MAEEERSAFFDYIVNGGDELAATKASEEYALGCLGREIELHAETRAEVERLKRALCEIADPTLTAEECQRLAREVLGWEQFAEPPWHS